MWLYEVYYWLTFNFMVKCDCGIQIVIVWEKDNMVVCQRGVSIYGILLVMENYPFCSGLTLMK